MLFFVAASLFVSIGQFARLLLTVVMVAISQAPSPESNPNPPLPVNGKVVHYTTFNLIGGEFVQQRAIRRFCYIGLRQQLQLPVTALVFVPANRILRPSRGFLPVRWNVGGLVYQVLAARFGAVIPWMTPRSHSVG